MARLTSLVVFFCFVSSVFAGGLTLKEENDVFAIPHTDHYYTQGLEIQYVGDAVKDGNTISRKMYGIRNLMYTPTDIENPAPQPWDRPWAGLTAGTYSEWELKKGEFTTKQWVLGVVGPWSQSEQIQTWFHGLIGSAKPMGWANQIPNEPILNYTWNRYNTVWSVGNGWAVDLTSRYGYSVGTAFDNAEGGFIGRAGWNLPQDFGMVPIEPTLSLSDFFDRFSLYLSAETLGRGVLHNVTLGGSLFQDGPYQELKPFVADNRIGASLGIRDIFGTRTCLDLSYSLVFRSREFYGQEMNMEYGSIGISLSRGF